jgi:hypothetical protein
MGLMLWTQVPRGIALLGQGADLADYNPRHCSPFAYIYTRKERDLDPCPRNEAKPGL